MFLDNNPLAFRMSTRKFRFDSFASEFGSLEEQSPDPIPDNDSGIGEINISLLINFGFFSCSRIRKTVFNFEVVIVV